VTSIPPPPRGIATVHEVLGPETDALVHAAWVSRLPWLVQGTTTRGGEAEPSDFALFGSEEARPAARRRWSALASRAAVTGAVHARQVHESVVRLHTAAPSDADTIPLLAEPCDGHATGDPDLMLAVTVADCVPVFLVSPLRRAIAVLHAGWRGAAAGVLEAGLEALAGLGAGPEDLLLHLGPSICGRCYEVGPEVFTALGLSAPDRPRPLDLRAVLAHRAVTAGITLQSISVSAHCTRCTNSGLFSHRGGDAQRQVGFLAVRT
jgi:YfiH family protein